MKQYSRKDFLKFLGAGTLALSGVGRWNEVYGAASTSRTLVHILLEGGPDFRHLFVPRPNENPQTYGYKFWNNRVTAIGRGTAINNYSSWMTAYERFYREFTRGGVTFGVLRRDRNNQVDTNGWLINQIDSGNAALVNNVHHSTSRDHAHSLLVLQSGIYETKAGSSNAGGWGGRLINQMPAGDRLVSFSRAIRPICNTNNKSRILSFTNSRSFGLEQPTTNSNGQLQQNDRGIRALQQYYGSLTGTISGPHAKFQNQRTKIQTLSSEIRTALPAGTAANIYSARIAALLAGSGRLANLDFARQIANLRDAFQVRSQLNMVMASLNYGGWDSHKNQAQDIEPQFNDLFGIDKGLHALIQEGVVDYNNTVFVLAGEFGRQLKSNGDAGTDHGRGNMVLVLGGSVQGNTSGYQGIYGEMFPAIESAQDGNGTALLDRFGRDIEGRTTFDHVLKRCADWLHGNDTGTTVFNNGTVSGLPAERSLNGLERITPNGSAISLNFLA